MEEAWNLLKQYDPMRPAHMRSQVFPEMSSDARMFHQYPGGMGSIKTRDVGKPYETRPATTRMLMPHERRERILADRDEAYDKANQFHQDRIRGMQNLPGASGSFSQGGADYNPFQPVNIDNFSYDDPRVQHALNYRDTMFLSPPQRRDDQEEARREMLEQMARDAVRQGQFSASYDRDPATMDPQTRSLFDAETQNMVDLHEQSRALPMQTFQSERYLPR